jgi:hypothetical protein
MDRNAAAWSRRYIGKLELCTGGVRGGDDKAPASVAKDADEAKITAEKRPVRRALKAGRTRGHGYS